jgi:hypothetical protein
MATQFLYHPVCEFIALFKTITGGMKGKEGVQARKEE